LANLTGATFKPAVGLSGNNQEIAEKFGQQILVFDFHLRNL